VHFVCDGIAIMTANEIKDAAGKVVGKVTSFATNPQMGQTFLLGYIPAKQDGDFFVMGRKLTRRDNQ
jgi:hypothetical protein